MAVVIVNVSDSVFSVNGIEYQKHFQSLVSGNLVRVVNIYDSKIEIVGNTNYTNFTINGSTFGSSENVQSALIPIMFNRELEGIEGRLDNLEDNQVTGVVQYSTLAELPATGTLNVSYKVTNDTTSSNNGYYHWNGSIYIKDADLIVQTIEKNNTSDGVSGKAVYYKSLQDSSNVIINKSNPLNELGGISSFTTSGFSLSTHNISESESKPIKDLSSFLRLSYDNESNAEVFIANTVPITLNTKNIKYYGGIRKADLSAIPSQLTWMVFDSDGGVNEDIIKLDYSNKNDIVVGYTQEKSVGVSNLRLTIIAEDSEWFFFLCEFDTTSATADGYTVRFYLNGMNGGAVGKLDLLNYTSNSKGEHINYTLKSVGDLNNSIFDKVEVIDASTSDNIVFIGDSYTQSDYTIPDKSYIANVSSLTDYQVRNYAKSGDDIIEAVTRINNNEIRYNTTLGIKDFNSKYAVIALYANDSPYRYWDINMFKENLRDLANRVRDLGIEPIVSSEFFLYNFFSANQGVADNALMKDLADELNVDFIDVAQSSMNFIKSRDDDFWNGSHPTTRTNSVMWKPISDYLHSLPKPKQSLKLFRNREVEDSFATDTLYKNVDERNSKYQEIRVGHGALTIPNKIYFDRQSLVSSPISETLNDEYLALINGESIDFDRHCLAEFTLPYKSSNIDNLRFKVDTNDTIFPWVRKKKAPFSTAKGTSFKYTGSPTVVLGDTYLVASSDSSINGKIITVTDDMDGYIFANSTTYAYTTKTATGTLTRQTGTGTSLINFDGVLATFEDDYYTEFNDRYEWVSLTSTPNTDGYWYIDNSNKLYVEGDKIIFIIRQTSGFSINGISLEIPTVEGVEKLDITGKYVEPLYYNNNSILPQRLTDTTANLSDWNQEGTIVASSPIGGANPRWTNGKVNLTNVNKISQSITYTNARASQKVQIQIWANYEPAKFTGTDLALSPITETSYDKTTLFIEIKSDSADATILQREVGLGFQQILIDTFLPPDLVNPTIKLYGTSKGVDVAYVDVLKY